MVPNMSCCGMCTFSISFSVFWCSKVLLLSLFQIGLHGFVCRPLDWQPPSVARRSGKLHRRQFIPQSFETGLLDGPQIGWDIFSDAPFQGGDRNGSFGTDIHHVTQYRFIVGYTPQGPGPVKFRKEKAVYAVKTYFALLGRRYSLLHVHGNTGSKLESHNLLGPLLIESALKLSISRLPWRQILFHSGFHQIGHVCGQTIVIRENAPNVLNGSGNGNVSKNPTRIGRRSFNADGDEFATVC